MSEFKLLTKNNNIYQPTLQSEETGEHVIFSNIKIHTPSAINSKVKLLDESWFTTKGMIDVTNSVLSSMGTDPTVIGTIQNVITKSISDGSLKIDSGVRQFTNNTGIAYNSGDIITLSFFFTTHETLQVIVGGISLVENVDWEKTPNYNNKITMLRDTNSGSLLVLGFGNINGTNSPTHPLINQNSYYTKHDMNIYYNLLARNQAISQEFSTSATYTLAYESLSKNNYAFIPVDLAVDVLDIQMYDVTGTTPIYPLNIQIRVADGKSNTMIYNNDTLTFTYYKTSRRIEVKSDALHTDFSSTLSLKVLPIALGSDQGLPTPPSNGTFLVTYDGTDVTYKQVAPTDGMFLIENNGGTISSREVQEKSVTYTYSDTTTETVRHLVIV